MRFASFALIGVLAGTSACTDETSVTSAPLRFTEVGSVGTPGRALAVGAAGLFVASEQGLSFSADGGATFEALPAEGLPAGHINVLLALGADDALVAYVWGKGLYRSVDAGQSFTQLPELVPFAVLGSLVTPRAKVVPFAKSVDPKNRDRAAIAGPGGLYLTEDAGATWTLLEPNLDDGKVYVLFNDVSLSGDTILAAAQNPKTLLPPTIGGLVGGGVLVSNDGGQIWERIHGEPLSEFPTAVSIGADGSLFAADMERGAFSYDGESQWSSLDGPRDVITMTAAGGGVSVGTGTRGAWRYEPAGWTAVGSGAVTDLERDHALAYDGSIYALESGIGTAPPPLAGGKVHLSFSFHVNLYHSFRGDAPDETGYGLDIEIIRHTLEWLERYPEVRADWDMENFFSVDGWLASDAPDILAKVKERVDAGTDDVRLMSWNNGAMSASTFEEFSAAVTRGVASNDAAFGRSVPGVQPQENMFSPDHVTWYPQLGIEWITLFNSMSPFTGFPLDQELEGVENFQTVTLSNGTDEMVMVPVYNHADVYDHGSLRAWIRQLSDTYSGDILLAIHFDADSETWINFESEIENIQDLDFVEYTTLQEYIDTHTVATTVTLEGDQADGIGDGYQSWAEKDINHEIFTKVAQARNVVDVARAIAPGDAVVESLVDDALTPRLLTLSTTNFGLASPYLAEDREVSARDYADQTVDAALAALGAADAQSPVADGTLDVVNTRASSGPALVRARFPVPASAYTDTTGLVIRDGATEIAATVGVIDDQADPVMLTATFVLDVGANAIQSLTWAYDPAAPSTATGGMSAGDLDLGSVPLEAPFTECLGSGRADATMTSGGAPTVNTRAASVEQLDVFDVPFCEASGQLERTATKHAGLDGIVITVSAQMATLADDLLAESVALTPFGCPADVAEISWRSFGGNTLTRPSRRQQETWNGQSADGWVAYHCADGPTVQIAHLVTERTSIAFSPMRNDDGHAIFAPLGTLWGDTPWHFGRRIGGIGIGDIVGIITPQFNPAAPDWSAKTVTYTLLVGEGIGETALDLFAHPPFARTGAYIAP